MAELAATLVQNLKELNAKERDYLMRFAYWGLPNETSGETERERWISKDMFDALMPQLIGTGLDTESMRCVFAGMDYHLDWLYAALFFACKGKPLEAACEIYPLEDNPKSKDSPLLPIVGVQDDSLRPIIGIQEDVDLLVVFTDDQDRVVVLCVEAKGDAPFDKVQLARKVVRLDRILVASGAKDQLKCKLLLMGPKMRKRKAGSCLAYAQSLPERPKFQGIRTHLGNMSTDIGCEELEKAFVELKGFPTTLKKITRTRASSGPTDDKGRHSFTGWKIEER